MADTILVTGASGKVAAAAIPQLLAQGAKVRVLLRNPAKAPPGVEVRTGDFDDAASVAGALEGVSAVFSVTPMHQKAEGWVKVLIAAALEAGKPRVVRLSALQASPAGPTGNTRSHGAIDRALQDSGLAYTILRPHIYMQNLFGSLQSIAKEGVLRQATGEARMGMIDTRDISEVAVKVLLDRGWERGIYELTGPKSISYREVAAALSAALGREIRYEPIAPEVMAQAARAWGLDEWQQGVMRDYSRAYANGWGDYSSGLVEKITGHPARSIEQFVREVLAPSLGK